MKKDTIVNLRINKEVKDSFQSIVSLDGYTASEVIEGFVLDVVNRGFIPVNIKSKLKPSKQIILTIPFIKQCLEKILKDEDKVISASLFGSYSTGEAKPHSDVDIFLETKEGFSLFDLTGLQKKLEKALGKQVDLVDGIEEPQVLHHINKQKIKLYEAA